MLIIGLDILVMRDTLVECGISPVKGLFSPVNLRDTPVKGFTPIKLAVTTVKKSLTTVNTLFTTINFSDSPVKRFIFPSKLVPLSDHPHTPAEIRRKKTTFFEKKVVSL